MNSLHPLSVRPLHCLQQEARMVQVEQVRVAAARMRRTSEGMRTKPAGVATGYCWLTTYTRNNLVREQVSGHDNIQAAKT